MTARAQNGGEIDDVRDIMLAFADRTGLSNPDVPPRRYLWTDAHAVCTFLGLHDATGEERYRELALALVGQVHDVLGRHRADDPREGWISGLDEDEGRAHPTAGGLRIGKELNERARSEPIDERLEWDRDGQYFHYLTKWMHALCRTAAVTGNDDYRQWALELAGAAYKGFVVAGPGGRRLCWKMSIDLSYPLVASSGHHDPLDGYITFNEVSKGADARLEREIERLADMIETREWATVDPLGIGGLLFDAGRVVQLTAIGRMGGATLARTLVEAAVRSLTAYASDSALSLPADRRLAFRELGLSIGLHAIDRMERVLDEHGERFDADMIDSLKASGRYVSFAADIEAFWHDGRNQQASSWQDHADINSVTLATSLLPDEFLAA